MTRSLFLCSCLFLGCATAGASSKPVAPATQPAITDGRFTVEVTGEGPPVVLIPGLTCGGRVWDATVEHLKGRHTLHVVTLAGFAGVPPVEPKEPFLRPARDALAEYLRDLDQPVVIGHSLGGFMALWLASSEPGIVWGAIAVDGLPSLGALSMQEPDAVAAFAAQIRAQMAETSSEAFAAQTRQTLAMQISDPRQAAAVAELSVQSDPATVGTAMAELLTTDLRPEVGRATVPVLVLGAGGGSEAEVQTRRSQYAEQVARIPDHELVMVPNTRHFVMLDAPQAFFAHVDRFLEAVQ